MVHTTAAALVSVNLPTHTHPSTAHTQEKGSHTLSTERSKQFAVQVCEVSPRHMALSSPPPAALSTPLRAPYTQHYQARPFSALGPILRPAWLRKTRFRKQLRHPTPNPSPPPKPPSPTPSTPPRPPSLLPDTMSAPDPSHIRVCPPPHPYHSSVLSLPTMPTLP